MYVRTYVCMYVCMYVCTYVCMYIRPWSPCNGPTQSHGMTSTLGHCYSIVLRTCFSPPYYISKVKDRMFSMCIPECLPFDRGRNGKMTYCKKNIKDDS